MHGHNTKKQADCFWFLKVYKRSEKGEIGTILLDVFYVFLFVIGLRLLKHLSLSLPFHFLFTPLSLPFNTLIYPYTLSYTL